MLASLQLVVYFPSRQGPKYFLTENINWLKDSYKQNGYILTPPLACDKAVELYEHLTKNKENKGMFLKLFPIRYRKQLFILKAHNLGYPGFPIALKNVPYEPSTLDNEEQQELFSQIERILAGRILEDKQISIFLRKQGWWPSEIFRALDTGYRNGTYKFFPGVIKHAWGVWRCARCNSIVTQVKPCWQCNRVECAYCDSCHELGEICGCSRLWILADQIKRFPRRDVKLQLDYSLTAAQNRASQALVRFLTGTQQQILVWAACGAGKTEVSFKAIQTMLQSGGEVLFAIPRRDVVMELAERLQKSFPNTSLAVHYGGQPWEAEGQLVVATTHQALRFYRRFSLVILDESDAFPYQGNEMLRFAIQRGKKQNAKVIEMTATPNNISNQRNYITIAARYHGYPLPEPNFLRIKLPSWDKLTTHPLPLDILTPLVETQAPWLVFVPTIDASKRIGNYLERNLKISVCFCYAADPERDYKKESLLQGKYQVMVTTSIMERGITIPNVQVMVLYCNHPVFNANSLIQMAGRVGRNKQFPTGKVLFVGDKLTSEVKTAINRIKYLNVQAKKQNLLKDNV